MKIVYNELIERFQEALGVSKHLIEETFNKPDATDVIANRFVSVKNFGDFCIIIVFDLDDKTVRFLYAYRIYPRLLDGIDISKTRPVGILKEFMDRYGESRSIPGCGEQKFLIDKRLGIFFLGIVNIEKYMEAVKNI